MKKILFSILLSIFAVNAFAAFPIINFQNLNGEYVDSKGIAYAGEIIRRKAGKTGK